MQSGSSDEIRLAFQHLQQAAWVFNNLLIKTQEVSQLEMTADLSKEALSMWMNVCLAQAQAAFLAFSKKQNRSQTQWHQLQAQVANYYERAFEAN